MKTIITVCLALLILLSVGPKFSYGQNEVEAKLMANAKTDTGVTSAVDVFGYKKLSVEFDIAGTAVVELECRVGSNGSWTTIVGGCIPATADTICTFVSLACAEIRTNVTTCSACTVSTFMQW